MRVCVLVLALYGAQAATAQTLDLALRVGTTGPGLEVTTPVAPSLDLRISGFYFSAESVRDLTRGPLAYRVGGELATGTIGVVLDYRIGTNLFLTVGVWNFVTGGEATVDPLGPAEIAGGLLDPDDLGSLTIESRFPERPSPYLGIAWRGGQKRRVGLLADIGAFYAGSPRFEAVGEGRLLATEAWTAELADAFASLRIYPHLSIGLAVRFDAPAH